PFLTANGWGRIVTISSVVAERPTGRSVAYSASKAGLEALPIAVALEVTERGVTANVLVIRALETPETRATEGEAKKPPSTRPEEVAALLLFLCSDDGGA